MGQHCDVYLCKAESVNRGGGGGGGLCMVFRGIGSGTVRVVYPAYTPQGTLSAFVPFSGSPGALCAPKTPLANNQLNPGYRRRQRSLQALDDRRAPNVGRFFFFLKKKKRNRSFTEHFELRLFDDSLHDFWRVQRFTGRNLTLSRRTESKYFFASRCKILRGPDKNEKNNCKYLVFVKTSRRLSDIRSNVKVKGVCLRKGRARVPTVKGPSALRALCSSFVAQFLVIFNIVPWIPGHDVTSVTVAVVRNSEK